MTILVGIDRAGYVLLQSFHTFSYSQVNLVINMAIRIDGIIRMSFHIREKDRLEI